ncbi:MAG: TIGR01777 family protein [Acidobacteriales bacterium]|nr:MAG: TIGR01777 family protein [Terriglobales bacterium]
MNITVTGGTGFIGRRVVRRLLAEGHSVHLLVRQANTGFGPSVQCSIWNAYTMEPAAESLAEADAVIHLAGEPVSQRWTPSARRRILDSRVIGTRRLIEAMSRLTHRPGVLVSAAAIGLYGSVGNEILTEASAPGEDFLAKVCLEWESAVDQAEALGVRVVKLRSGMVLGKEGGALAQMLTPFQWGLGGRLALGSQWVSWIHVEDLVELILFALRTAAVRGPVNATSPHPVTNSEFTSELAGVLHRPAFFTIPAFALRSLFGEMAEIMLASQRVLPKAALAAGFEFRYPGLRQALQNLLS